MEPGSSVAVIGLGAVGLGVCTPVILLVSCSVYASTCQVNLWLPCYVVEGSRNRGAAKIIGIDKNNNKRKKGEAFGMTDFINPTVGSQQKPVSELIKDLTGGLGVDCCFECTGDPHLLNQALESTKVVCTQHNIISIVTHS